MDVSEICGILRMHYRNKSSWSLLILINQFEIFHQNIYLYFQSYCMTLPEIIIKFRLNTLMLIVTHSANIYTQNNSIT